MGDTGRGDDVFPWCNFALKDASLSYEKLVVVATDGARAMIGDQKGLQGRRINVLETRNLSEIMASPRTYWG